MANLKAEVALEWGDGEYQFSLKAAQIEELEHVCGEGIGRICARVFTKVDYSYKMIRATVRLGLIGGGMSAVDAERLCKAYVDGVPIDATNDPSSPLKTAFAILKAVHFGWEELPKADAGEQESPETKQTSGSTAPHSSEPGLTPQPLAE